LVDRPHRASVSTRRAVLRNIYIGITRFDQLQQTLGISRKVLAERLKWLVDRGVLERREYSSRPPRHEYALTPMGTELCDLLLVMVRWGDRWLAGEAGPPVPAPCVRPDQPCRTDLLGLRRADACH
jgi:DNA-binding HxlR family transcriptional regulator